MAVLISLFPILMPTAPKTPSRSSLISSDCSTTSVHCVFTLYNFIPKSLSSHKRRQAVVQSRYHSCWGILTAATQLTRQSCVRTTTSLHPFMEANRNDVLSEGAYQQQLHNPRFHRSTSRRASVTPSTALHRPAALFTQ